MPTANTQFVAANSVVDRSTLASALAKATSALLAARNEHGLWTGELSSSALSTATAIAAIAVFNQYSDSVNDLDPDLIYNGLKWLADHANADGGWGDSVRSVSNLSTTTLCWAAFASVPNATEKFARTVEAATKWLEDHGGGTEPQQVSEAILNFYGKDKTFSVPILTMCALAGRLGHITVGFKSVAPLPI